jgi:hypothetical protein
MVATETARIDSHVANKTAQDNGTVGAVTDDVLFLPRS